MTTTRYLAREIGLSKLVKLCDRFYAHCFLTPSIDQFIRDHHDPHGERLGKWLYEMMDASSCVWSDDLKTRDKQPVETSAGPVTVRDRQSAHFAAWFCTKRAKAESGKRFSCGDCVVWMRLFGLAAREEGLMEHMQFLSFVESFLDRFIGFYNSSAAAHVQASLAWSADRETVARYLQRRVMAELP